MGLGAAMAGGLPAASRGRQVNDWYPTPADVTEAMLTEFASLFTEVWEPCAGDGAMVDVLFDYGIPAVATDLAPQRRDIRQLDFFAAGSMPGPASAIVTNPPFMHVERIVKHAFETVGCRRMALVLKSQYWHAAGRLPMFRYYQPSIVAPLTWRPDFLGLGRPVMEVQWCIWETPCATVTRYHPLARKRA